MNEDRFAKHVTFPSGVRWEPTDPKPMDQTPYLDYLDREEEKVRGQQGIYTAEELRLLLGVVETSQKKQGS